MTRLLDLIRDCRHRQVEELEIIKVGDHELKMKDGKFWSEGRFWSLEEVVIELMKRSRALPKPLPASPTTHRVRISSANVRNVTGGVGAVVELMRPRALPEPEAGKATAEREVVPTAAPAKRFYRRGGR